MKPSNDIDVLT